MSVKETSSPLDPFLLEILACPVCKTPVELKENDRLVCANCHRAYPIRDGIPVMIVDEAKIEGGPAPSSAQ
jgi:uncharacterized protein YbaR (Trm112 family)